MQIIFCTVGNVKRTRDAEEEKPNQSKRPRRRENDADSDSEDTTELADRLAKRMANRKMKTDEVIRPVHHQTPDRNETFAQTPSRNVTRAQTPASNSSSYINDRSGQFSSPTGSAGMASNVSSNYVKVIDAYCRDMNRSEVDRLRAEVERERERSKFEMERLRADNERAWRDKLYDSANTSFHFNHTPGGPSL